MLATGCRIQPTAGSLAPEALVGRVDHNVATQLPLATVSFSLPEVRIRSMGFDEYEVKILFKTAMVMGYFREAD